uniref:Uncharacterized protein n=1 Tax=Romanomermis culicivorax TaxID=13658 RepID=A0A915JN09_ROMCU
LRKGKGKGRGRGKGKGKGRGQGKGKDKGKLQYKKVKKQLHTIVVSAKHKSQPNFETISKNALNTGKCISQVQSFIQFRCHAICKLESVTGANWLYGTYHSLGDISIPAYTPAQLYAAVQKLHCM